MSLLNGIGLFKGIMAKMDWLDQNQRVLSQNIANSDTPGFRPQQLKDADFKSYLGASDSTKSSAPQVRLEATDPKHFGLVNAAYTSPGQTKSKHTYESSPDNNGVVIEEQLFKANENGVNYQIATDLYRRNIGMLRMVLGNSR